MRSPSNTCHSILKYHTIHLIKVNYKSSYPESYFTYNVSVIQMCADCIHWSSLQSLNCCTFNIIGIFCITKFRIAHFHSMLKTEISVLSLLHQRQDPLACSFLQKDLMYWHVKYVQKKLLLFNCVVICIHP